MKYPLALHSKLEEVNSVVSKWKLEVDFNDVMKWILQFDPEDYNIALSVIQNLNVISAEDLKGALSIAYSKLMRKAVERDAKISTKNTLFAGLGSAGKSGAMLSYHFRLINGISEENFLDAETEHFIEEGKIENIVLVDDVVATGAQASREIIELQSRVTALGVKNIFLLTVCGFKNGIGLIEEKTKAHTFSAFEYCQEDTATSFDSPFYQGINHSERERIKQRLDYYGRICSRMPFGYGNIGAFIVFSHNTPNCTLPIIWSDQNDWIPLFRRSRRINGIASFYKQFDKAVQQKTETATKLTSPASAPIDLAKVTLVLFVEGKTDELFFDRLIAGHRLASQVGTAGIVTFSFGGIDSLIRYAPIVLDGRERGIAVLESDVNDRAAVLNRLKGIPCIFLKPNMTSLVNLPQLFADEELAADLPPFSREIIEAPSDSAYSELEQHLFRRGPVSQSHARLRRVVDLHIDPVALAQFVQEIKATLDKVTDPKKDETPRARSRATRS